MLYTGYVNTGPNSKGVSKGNKSCYLDDSVNCLMARCISYVSLLLSLFSAATPTSKNHICHYFCLTLFVYSFRLQLSIDNYRLWAVRKINKSHQTSDDVQYFFIYFLNFFLHRDTKALVQEYQQRIPLQITGS